MGLFGFEIKRKKKHNNLTDLERELALQTRLQNKQLRDAQMSLKLKEIELQKMELDAEMEELLPEDEGNILGLDEADMGLVNLLQKTGLLKGFGIPQEQGIQPPSSATPEAETEKKPSPLLGKIPKPILKEMKKIPKEELHELIEQL